MQKRIIIIIIIIIRYLLTSYNVTSMVILLLQSSLTSSCNRFSSHKFKGHLHHINLFSLSFLFCLKKKKEIFDLCVFLINKNHLNNQ